MDEPLPGMPTRLFVATPTKLLNFADCKRKYRYTYLETPRPPKGPPWAHNTVGAVVHEVLADFYGRWPAQRRTPDEVVGKMRSSWRQEGFRDERQSATWRERSTELVLGYVRESDPYYEPLAVERTVSFTTERASLRGRVDRIDERPGRDGTGSTELAIVDYKTGRRPLTSMDARSSLAMALYVLGARRVLHRGCTRVELHHLPTNTIAVADHDDESLARHLRRAESIADDAAAAEARCPQGRRVAPPRDPWAGLDEPDLAEAG
jgi:RecB family exonuclease